MSELVRLELEERGDVVIAHVAGELDLAGAGKTRDAIAEAVAPTARGVVVDFSQLEFIDSSGVAMLFSLARRFAGRRQQFRVAAPEDGPVARVLGIVEFERAAPIDADLEQALVGME
jgi:anti-anti-sigma factor